MPFEFWNAIAEQVPITMVVAFIAWVLHKQTRETHLLVEKLISTLDRINGRMDRAEELLRQEHADQADDLREIKDDVKEIRIDQQRSYHA